MESPQEVPLPAPGSPILTACGGQSHYEKDTPTAVYRGRRVYFCLPACREDFERDLPAPAWRTILRLDR